LAQGLDAGEQAAVGGRAERDAAGRDLQAVGLRIFVVPLQQNPHRTTVRHGDRQAGGVSQQLGQLLGDVSGRRDGAHRQIWLDPEVSGRVGPHRHGKGDDVTELSHRESTHG
jgi:hypothetical protein